MTWAERTSDIQVGDKICYSKRFLQSTGQLTGDAPFGRGIVPAIKPLGDIRLAELEWDNPELPERVK